jgi:N-acetylneuraminate synthase
MSYNFKDLVVLDMANNHQGDLSHGLKIIREFSTLVEKFDLNLCIKFQFRQLDTFIHEEFRNKKDIPHIPRFIETELSNEEYGELHREAKKLGFITACTPFDEASVSLIEEMGFDLIKIASCSANDTPLLERIKKSSMPILASTGGLSLMEIDYLYEMYKGNLAGFAMHHCVSIYPTPPDCYNLNQIKLLINRYSGTEVGWSTHEDPNDFNAVMMAFAAGATMLERHVGLATDKYKLNNYSSTPKQVKTWLEAFVAAKKMMGGKNRAPAAEVEKKALLSLQRGAYLKDDKSKGELIGPEDIFLAMPAMQNQITAQNLPHNLTLTSNLKRNQPIIFGEHETYFQKDMTSQLDSSILSIRSMLREAKINLPNGTELELSHHYGIDHFREFGACLVTLVNEDYCKKLVIQLPRQKHPYHYHKVKKETFQVLYGDLNLEVDGSENSLSNGEMITVHPGEWHKFDTLNGVIFEEISTKSLPHDSYYADENIGKNNNRKSKIDF